MYKDHFTLPYKRKERKKLKAATILHTHFGKDKEGEEESNTVPEREWRRLLKKRKELNDYFGWTLAHSCLEALLFLVLLPFFYFFLWLYLINGFNFLGISEISHKLIFA